MTRSSLAVVTTLATSLMVAGSSGHAQTAPAPATATKPPRTMSEVIAATTAADWRDLDPEDTLYLQLLAGRVVIELAPAFAFSPISAPGRRTYGSPVDGRACRPPHTA